MASAGASGGGFTRAHDLRVSGRVGPSGEQQGGLVVRGGRAGSTQDGEAVGLRPQASKKDRRTLRPLVVTGPPISRGVEAVGGVRESFV